MPYYPPQGAHRAPTTSPAITAGRAASPLRDEFDPYADASDLARELERTREALAAMTALASDQVTACRVLAWLDGGA